MTKYHVNPATGVPGVCTASVRACPHGGSEVHGDSPAEAVKLFEKHAGASVATPVKKPKARKVPQLLGKRAFDDLSPYDYAPHRREGDRLLRERQKIDSSDEAYKKAWTAYWTYTKAYEAEWSANIAMAKSRVGRAMSVSHEFPDSTLEELVTSGTVREATPLHPELEEKYSELAISYAWADKETREKFNGLPTRYYRAFKSGNLSRGYGEAAFKSLVLAADELHSSDPTWTPEERFVPPRTAHRQAPRGVERPGLAKDMQNVSPTTYSLLEDYAKLKFGEDRADEFWTTVTSDSVNKPKISDYFRAMKAFK